MNATKKPTLYDRMEKAMPMCMIGNLDRLGFPLPADLVFLVEHEIDITESGEDGTSRRNLKPLRNWLAKWKPLTDADK